jgi:hypothetical protein
MVHQRVRLADGRTATLDWLREDELPEVMEALNSVIREGKYLFMNSEITDMEEERRWFDWADEGLVAMGCGEVCMKAVFFHYRHYSLLVKTQLLPPSEHMCILSIRTKRCALGVQVCRLRLLLARAPA